jgi:hypothetical protein
VEGVSRERGDFVEAVPCTRNLCNVYHLNSRQQEM